MSELILFTAGFPYGKGEPFLETEVDYLSQHFDEIFIISIDTIKDKRRKLPKNCSSEILNVKLGTIDKLKSLRFLFTSLFWKEFKLVGHVYNLKRSLRIVKTMLASIYRAKKIQSHVKKLKGSKSQIFYSYWCDDSALALSFMKCEKPSIKAISRVHGWDLYFEASSINYLPYRKFIAGNLSLICPISVKGKKYIKERWEVTDANIKVCRLGVEPIEQKRDSKKNILVSCSNLIELKRVELIAESISKSKTNYIWHHFGSGPLAEEVSAKATKLIDKSNFKLHGHVANEGVKSWYSKNCPKLFINLSTTEGVPVSIMEVMSLGTPVIATNVGGTSEIVSNENGKLLEPNPNAGEVAEAIDYFFNISEEDYSKYSEIAYNTWKEKYNAEKNYKKFLETISSL